MKLLMISGNYHPTIGGTEKECQKQAEYLHSLGIKVMVLTQYLEGLPQYEVINGVSVYRKIKVSRPWAITYMLSVLQFMIAKRDEYDIVQCFGIFYHTTAAVIMRYLYKKKVINRVESAGAGGDLRRMKGMKYGLLIALTWKKVDRIVAVSKGICNELISHRVHMEKIVNIPNSVDTEVFTLSEIKSWENPFEILFVGRLTEAKGVGVLLQALKNMITKGYNDLLLTVVGDGDLRKELENMTLSLGLKKYVVFTGYKKDVMEYYQTSHILVLPSNWEGLPLVLLEGMACGLPIVASDLSGNREAIEDGVNGLLFTPGKEDELTSKIIYFLEHPEVAKHMGRTCREKAVALFSLKNSIHKYVELYKSLLSQ